MSTATPRRTRTRIVDQHATWIAVNPIQGCPKRCTYCFLHERGQAGVAPEFLTDPATTVDALLASSFYSPDRPVALYTWTDVMALPSSRAHLQAILQVLGKRGVGNPIVLITKCHIPDEILADLAATRRAGVPIVVYLSLSGLDDSVERGVRHAPLWANFGRLAGAGIPIVHYWRPGTPASASEEVMERVLDHAAAYAVCTMAAGLKVEAGALDRITGLWPQLAHVDGVTRAEGVYPRKFWDFIHRSAERHPAYPLFHTNSCALAYALGRADEFGIVDGEICRQRNHCLPEQRVRCRRADAARSRPDAARVQAAMTARGLEKVPFTMSADGREIAVHARVDTAVAAALTHDLATRVVVDRDPADAYWNSGTAGALPLIIE